MHSRPVWLLCIAACLSAGSISCGREAPPPELPPRAIKWERVSTNAAGEQRVISGIVTAVSDTKLAFEVSGTVMEVRVDLGDVVRAGDVLARLDPEPLQLTVADAEAELSKFTALQQSARADFERTSRLFEAQVASRQEYDRAEAMADSRDSQVEAARARLNLAKRDLRRSTLEAPFSGAISVREVEPAMEIAGGQVVFEMDSGESGLRVEVQMPETLIARIKQGDAAEVSFPSMNEMRAGSDENPRFEAVVSEVGTRAGAGNAFPVRANLKAPPPGLRPGMTAEVFFTLSRSVGGVDDVGGMLIPMAAALAEEDGFSVFVFDRASSTVRKQRIQSGGVRDNDVAVLEGLEGGEIIATAGVSFLRDGQEVTLLDERLLRRGGL